MAQSNNKKVRVIGNGHSPSDICCTDDYMINLRPFNRILDVDYEKNRIKVEAGIMFVDLNAYLDKIGMAFPM